MYGLDPIELLAGSLPRRQARLVEAWAELHQSELVTDWGPLRDPNLFGKVRLDPEVHTLVWPNGADFDPATLHDWPDLLPAMEERARSWDSAGVPNEAMQRTRDEAKRCG